MCELEFAEIGGLIVKHEERIKDFALILKLKNNQLMKRRLEKGFTQQAMAEAIGISSGQYVSYENLRVNPMGTKDEWKPSALKVAEYYGVSPWELWSSDILLVKESDAIREFNADEVGLLTGGYSELAALPPSEIYDAKERVDMLNKAVSGLNDREKELIYRRFDKKMTLEEAGKNLPSMDGEISYDITRNRVAQVEAKIIRKLRGNDELRKYIKGKENRKIWV